MMMPTIPKNTLPNIISNRYHLSPLMISGSVNIRADREVRAMIIIIMGEMIPAFTAASPRIKAPTVDRALVVNDGLLKSLSLRISKEVIIIIISIKAGKGTVSLWDAKLISRLVGNIS